MKMCQAVPRVVRVNYVNESPTTTTTMIKRYTVIIIRFIIESVPRCADNSGTNFSRPPRPPGGGRLSGIIASPRWPVTATIIHKLIIEA